ncbi:MAG: TolC family protein [Saprospirales bacterium]|nr:TolC family protein [Saprospirales bacterium]
MRRQLHFLVIFLLIGFALPMWGQDPWSLIKCVEYARENSLIMQQAELGIQRAEINLKRQKNSRYPSLNASANGGAQLGRTIDPTTNSFNNSTIYYNSLGLSAGAMLYNGGRINHAIAQGKYDLEASKLDADASFNSMALSIAGGYLQILLSQEQVENATRQLEQSQALLDQTDKLVNAGALAPNERLTIEAQVALNEQNLIQAENALESSYLILRQLLELAPSEPFDIVRPTVTIPATANPDGLSWQEVYVGAMGTQPQIEAGEMRMASAEENFYQARSLALPTLSIFANLNSSWSSLAKSIDGTETQFYPIQLKQPDGTIVSFEIGQDVPIFVDDPYFNQLNENFGQSIGLNLSVPLYNGSRAKLTQQEVEIGVLAAKVANDQTRQQLQSDVQRAVNDAQAAKRSYEAAQRALNASQAAFGNAEKRFQIGALNTYEFTVAKTNLDSAQLSFTQAKFQYIFTLKVIDFYLGRPLNLE